MLEEMIIGKLDEKDQAAIDAQMEKEIDEERKKGLIPQDQSEYGLWKKK